MRGKVSSGDVHGPPWAGLVRNVCRNERRQYSSWRSGSGCAHPQLHCLVCLCSASAAGWRVWLSDYKQTLAAHVAADQSDLRRLRASARMKTVSPKYVPREWMLVWAPASPCAQLLWQCDPNATNMPGATDAESLAHD